MRPRMTYYWVWVILALWLIPTAPLAQNSKSPFTYQTGRAHKKTKIFLVAGSSEAANFAQEIIDQKAYLLRAGFSENEIACYYVPPYQEHYVADEAQFKALLPELRNCFLANVNQLREDLKSASKGKPEFLYLYITSHGQEPFDQKGSKPGVDRTSRYRYRRLAAYPPLREHHLAMDALPDGAANFWEILGSYRSGVPSEALFLTTSNLTAWLKKYFDKTPKFLVLQACYSGGFLENPEKPQLPTLKDLKNVTVMTAARQDRESFGCQPGTRHTLFGGTYLAAWPEEPQSPLSWDWTQMFSQLQKRVQDLEAQEKVSPPSLPQFFTNQSVLKP